MRAATRQQFIIDILDVWLPAANLGLVNLNDGTLGIFGYRLLLLLSSAQTLTHGSHSVISSVLALRTQWLAVNTK